MRLRRILAWTTLLAAIRQGLAWTCDKGGHYGTRARAWLTARAEPHLAPLRQRFGTWPHFWQHFAISFALGILIEAGVHFFGHGVDAVEDTQRWSRDKTIALTRLYRQEGWIDAAPLPAGISRFAFIDVDEASWRDESWGGGEPFLQPHAQVRALVDAAFASGARVVYLDLLLDGPGDEADRAWLAALARKAAPPGGERHLLVARSLRHSLAGDALPRLRKALWDDTPAGGQGVRIHPVLPYFPVDADLRIREWHIGQAASAPGGGPALFYPSPQLALHCLQRAWPGGIEHGGLAARCEAIGRPMADAADALHDGPAGHDALASTILFSLGTSGHLGYSRWPALAVLGGDPIDAFRNAVVVIGASYRESRDHHYTPVGRLPGAVLNLNALDTMLRHGQLHELPGAVKWPLALAIIAAVAAVFAVANRLAAVVISTVLVFGAFAFVIGPWLLLNGLWFDFGAPMLGIQLHRTIEEFIEGRKRARRGETDNALPEDHHP